MFFPQVAFGRLSFLAKEKSMQKLEEIIAAVDGFVWDIPLIVLILGVGIYLTVRLVFLPVRKLGRAFKYMFEKEEGAGEVSSFGALCTALSATIGTGNIVGVATAICAGGPGALFWMWLAAFFGMATKYAEGLLAVKYRKVYPDGHTLGGPFYYIENGLGKRWKFLAVIFAFAAIYKQKPRAFGFRKVRLRYLFVALLLAFGLLFSLNWVNGWFVQLLEWMGYRAPGSQLPELSDREYALIYQLPSLAGAGFFGVLLVVAVLPALCEETIFRGIILEGIKDVGTVAACLLGGLLFSVFHMNPTQTVYQFICGAAFTLLAIRAGSVWPTVLVHFLNNAVIIFDYKFDFLSKISEGGAVAVYVVSAVCLAASLAYLIFFDRKGGRRKEGKIKPFLLPALVGLILCAVMWIFNFAAGFGG